MKETNQPLEDNRIRTGEDLWIVRANLSEIFRSILEIMSLGIPTNMTELNLWKEETVMRKINPIGVNEVIKRVLPLARHIRTRRSTNQEERGLKERKELNERREEREEQAQQDRQVPDRDTRRVLRVILLRPREQLQSVE